MIGNRRGAKLFPILARGFEKLPALCGKVLEALFFCYCEPNPTAINMNHGNPHSE